MLKRLSSFIANPAPAFLALAAMGCSSGPTLGSDVVCGAGTVVVDGACVPASDGSVAPDSTGGDGTPPADSVSIDSASISDSTGLEAAADSSTEAPSPGDSAGDAPEAEAGPTWSADPCEATYIANCAKDCGGPDPVCTNWMSCSTPKDVVGFGTAAFRMPAAKDIDSCSSSCAWTTGAIGLQLRVESPSYGNKIRIKIAPPWKLAMSAPTSCATPTNKPNCLILPYVGTGVSLPVFIYTTDKSAPARTFTFEELAPPVSCD